MKDAKGEEAKKRGMKRFKTRENALSYELNPFLPSSFPPLLLCTFALIS